MSFRCTASTFFAKLPAARIGLEACGASHYWARVLHGLGHESVLLPPQYIKPYVKRGKNDVVDAAAICEAMSRPGKAGAVHTWVERSETHHHSNGIGGFHFAQPTLRIATHQFGTQTAALISPNSRAILRHEAPASSVT